MLTCGLGGCRSRRRPRQPGRSRAVWDQYGIGTPPPLPRGRQAGAPRRAGRHRRADAVAVRCSSRTDASARQRVRGRPRPSGCSGSREWKPSKVRVGPRPRRDGSVPRLAHLGMGDGRRAWVLLIDGQVEGLRLPRVGRARDPRTGSGPRHRRPQQGGRRQLRWTGTPARVGWAR